MRERAAGIGLVDDVARRSGERAPRGYCGNGSRWGLAIHYSHEKNLMGTAGALKKVQKFFDGFPILVMSGDGLSDVDLSALYQFHKKKGSIATMVTKAVDSRFDYGVTMSDKSGRITGFMEKPSWSQVFSNQVNTGIYLFEPEILRMIPKGVYDFGHELWPKLLKLRKPIYAWEWKGYWCDVGNLTEYRKAQHHSLDELVGINIPGKELQRRVWVQENAKIHPRAILKAPCLIGKGAEIMEGAQVGPYTVVGDRSIIAPSAVLKNCILFENVAVGSKVHLDNCIVGANGHITENITVYEAAVLSIRK
ncbi:MAG TPA: NDP-sugar synthase [Elusimicrobiota bacterium]|nr:NDP-sugar synthase [Elusimicrobiota bacterium]